MTNSTNTYLSRFSFSGKENELSFSDYNKLVDQEVTLPSFYKLPPEKPIFTISITLSDAGHGEQFSVEDADGNVLGEVFSDIIDAYDHVRNDLNGEAEIKDYTGGGSMPVVSDPGLSVELLAKRAYVEFLGYADAYVAAPTDIVAVFDFLDAHPLFYVQDDDQEDGWQVRGHVSRLYVHICLDENDKPFVMLGGGQAVSSDRITLHEFVDLDAAGDTYEEALIELAAHAHMRYDVDGSLRHVTAGPTD